MKLCCFSPVHVSSISQQQHTRYVKFFDYIVQSGRAVLYPVYQGQYERNRIRPWPLTHELVSEQFNDLSRSIQYLGTRSDINSKKLAYVGVSLGSAEGVILATLLQDKLRDRNFPGWRISAPEIPCGRRPDRLRAQIEDAGVDGERPLRFFVFPDKSQNPLFAMLGTPASDKRHVVMESPHDVTVQRDQLVREVLAWLDKYLGPAD